MLSIIMHVTSSLGEYDQIIGELLIYYQFGMSGVFIPTFNYVLYNDNFYVFFHQILS